MNILAFSGRKQSGKSTAAEYVQAVISNNLLNIKYKIYSFADPLKTDICMNILGLTHSQCYGSDEDKNTLTDIVWNGEQLSARKVMEIVGTDIFRSLKSNVWVESTLRKIISEKPDLAIIPDCRFPNEVEEILRYSGHVIRLTLDPFHSESDSESALDRDKYDWNRFSTIIDNSTMTEVEKNKNVLNFILEKGILSL